MVTQTLFQSHRQALAVALPFLVIFRGNRDEQLSFILYVDEMHTNLFAF